MKRCAAQVQDPAVEEQRYIQEVREGIIEGRKQIAAGKCIVGTENFMNYVQSIRDVRTETQKVYG